MQDRTYERRMAELTCAFYAQVGQSFSDTRQRPWQGFERLSEELNLSRMSSVSVLDIACGNLRFERYLETLVPHVESCCVDADDALVATGTTRDIVHLITSDVISSLIDDTFSAVLADVGPFDLAVTFGFMHHVPSETLRIRLARVMLEHVRVGGHALFSFWQFSKDERIMRKAKTIPEGYAGDYLLGWQDATDVWRFCHDASEDEIDKLVGSLADIARERLRYSADGKRNNLNRYLILERI